MRHLYLLWLAFNSLFAVLFMLHAHAEEAANTEEVKEPTHSTLIFPSPADVKWDSLRFLTNRVQNIVLDNEPVQTAFLAVLSASTNAASGRQETPPFACVILPPEDPSRRVTVQFKEVPLGLALQTIADVSNYKLTVLQSRTILLFEPNRADIMCVRIHYIPTSTIQEIAQISRIKDDNVRLDEWFKARGIRMPRGAEAIFHPRVNCVSLKNYAHELTLMESLLTLGERQVRTNSQSSR